MFQIIHYTLIYILTIHIIFFFNFPAIVLGCLVTYLQEKLGEIYDTVGKLKQNHVIYMAIARAIQNELRLLNCQQWLLRKWFYDKGLSVDHDVKVIYLKNPLIRFFFHCWKSNNNIAELTLLNKVNVILTLYNFRININNCPCNSKTSILWTLIELWFLIHARIYGLG